MEAGDTYIRPSRRSPSSVVVRRCRPSSSFRPSVRRPSSSAVSVHPSVVVRRPSSAVVHRPCLVQIQHVSTIFVVWEHDKIKYLLKDLGGEVPKEVESWSTLNYDTLVDIRYSRSRKGGSLRTTLSLPEKAVRSKRRFGPKIVNTEISFFEIHR